MTLATVISALEEDHGFDEGSIAFLKDKKFGEDDFAFLLDILYHQDETFTQRRKRLFGSRLETILQRGDAAEMTAGRYERNVDSFHEISSEQALVRERMRFAVEYNIALAQGLCKEGVDQELVERPFTPKEEEKLRSIYEGFRTKDYAAVKLMERKTDHDIVAANTWVAIRAQQLGMDGKLMRKITHFARTSADVNTNVMGHLYSRAIGQWTKSLNKLLGTLMRKADDYQCITCVANTHGQKAQLTTLGHTYANLAEQIRQHVQPLLKDQKLLLEGKIAGAIGTDVDLQAAFPGFDPEQMYKHVVEDIFSLDYVNLGVDQDISNASFTRALDTIVKVGRVVQKAATDTWLLASRKELKKLTKGGESGSSAMPQKANPFLAEGCEALMGFVAKGIEQVEEMIIAYRDQGDLRRSITKREGYHPLMLAIIGIERINTELNKYSPNILETERTVCLEGPKIASSAVQTYLRAKGVADAYDGLKGVVMQPSVSYEAVEVYVAGLVEQGTIDETTGDTVKGMLCSVMDRENYFPALEEKLSVDDTEGVRAIVELIEGRNNNMKLRERLLGSAVGDTSLMIDNAQDTFEKLERYAA